MLREPADAADAVQDTFVIAAAKLAQLRDPSKLRTWLYAVARNECHRRLRDRKVAPGLDEMPEPADESPEVGTDTERAELRKLVHDALIGLNIGDREVIELNLRHEFEAQELAEALGVTRNHAHAMLSRARTQFRTSLGALLVARTGRESCAELDELLASWDGQMTVLLRKQVNRHIDNCDICGERRRRELAPAALFSLLPLAALPRGLRERIMKLCADSTPQAVQHRHNVTQRAGSFRDGGFPATTALPGAGRWQAARRGTLIAAPAAAVLIIVAIVLGALAANGTHPKDTSATGPLGPTISASPGSGASGSPVSSGSPSSPGAHPTGTVVAGVVPVPGSTATAGRSLGPSPTTGPTPARSPSRSPKPSHSPTPSRSPTPAPTTPSPTPKVTTGTVAVSPNSVTLTQNAAGGPPTGTFTLTAVGGPLSHFWIVIPVSGLTASPASGSLPTGGSVTITLTLSRPVALDTQITVNPGDVAVTVLFTPANTPPPT